MNDCCKNCPDRWVNETGRCHDTCEKYIEACERHKHIKERMKEELNSDHTAYLEDIKSKRRKK